MVGHVSGSPRRRFAVVKHLLDIWGFPLMGVNGGTPKWMVYDGKKSTISTDDLPPPGCGNPHMSANLPAEKLLEIGDHHGSCDLEALGDLDRRELLENRFVHLKGSKPEGWSLSWQIIADHDCISVINPYFRTKSHMEPLEPRCLDPYINWAKECCETYPILRRLHDSLLEGYPYVAHHACSYPNMVRNSRCLAPQNHQN